MNILFSFILKGGSVVIALLLVPLTINYINPVQYGIWLTISAMVYWINVFDLGVGNGLKNEIAYSLALKDETKIRTYISTTYAVLSIIALLIFIIFYLLSSFFNWNKILNISSKINYDIHSLIIIVLAFFCVQFVVQIIDAVLSATQQVFKSSIILFFGQLICLIGIYLLTLTVPGKLIILVIVLASTPILASVIGSIYLYNNELKRFAPSFQSIDFRHIKKLLNIGGTFFFIQIGAMILIHSNNFIITRILGPEAVTIYNIPFRLFSFLSMLFAIIIMPYWSAFTDAYANKDFEWIKNNIKKVRIIWLTISLLGIVVFMFSDFLYKVWINDAVRIPTALSFCMLIYIIIYMWHTLHVYFLNGVGKIRLQLFLVILCSLVNIPLAIYLGRHFGLLGIVISNSVIFLIMGTIYTIQYNKIIFGTATNIWNK